METEINEQEEKRVDKMCLTLAYIGVILISICMATGVIAIQAYSGDNVTIPIDKDYSYYSIIDNSTPIQFTLTQESSNIIIQFDKYSVDDNFTLIFFDKDKEIVKEYVRSGGGSSGGAVRTIYKNQTQIQYVEIPNEVVKEITKEVPVDKEVVNEVAKIDKKAIYVLLGIFVILLMILITLILSKRNERRLEDNNE